MDEKEIRLNAFYDKLTELEELKSNSDLTNKIVEIQRKMESCGDSAPEIEEVNRILTTVSFAFEELFINTYDVLKNSCDEYLATDSSLVELWNQIESEKEEEKKAKEQSNSYPYMKFYTNPQNSDISEGNNIDFNWGNIDKNNVNNNFEDIMKKYNSVPQNSYILESNNIDFNWGNIDKNNINNNFEDFMMQNNSVVYKEKGEK